jgi:hypothetical protein
MEADSEVRHARERAAYERHRAELERRHPGKIALLCGDELLGVFATREEAAVTAFKRLGPRQCMTQEIGQPVHLLYLYGVPDPDAEPPPLQSVPSFEVEEAAYERIRAELERDHTGEVALLRGQELIGLFPDLTAACVEGRRRFGLEPIYVREVGDPVYFFPYGVLPQQRAEKGTGRATEPQDGHAAEPGRR